MATKLAVFDALEAGIRNLVVLAEHVPVHDVMEFVAAAKGAGAQLSVRILPGSSRRVSARSESCQASPRNFSARLGGCDLAQRQSRHPRVSRYRARGLWGIGVLGIGGDPVLGTTTADALRIFDGDAKTKAVVIVGELGGTMEEEAAEYAAQTKMSSRKPIVAFIAGRSAPPGRRMGHAGAIVIGSRGSGESKVQTLRDAGATVLDTPSDIGSVLRNVLS